MCKGYHTHPKTLTLERSCETVRTESFYIILQIQFTCVHLMNSSTFISVLYGTRMIYAIHVYGSRHFPIISHIEVYLKVHRTKITKPILILSVNLPIPICFSSTSTFGLSVPPRPQNPCNNYCLQSPLTYPYNHYCLTCLPCWPTFSTSFSTSCHCLSSYSRQHHSRYPPPGTKWMRTF